MRGGLVRASRRTGITGDLAADGWEVILRGTDRLEMEPADDGRAVVLRAVMTDGETTQQKLSSHGIIYREIWREGMDYKAGDAVTWGGSLWIALEDTDSKPGDGSHAWRLAVKKGRDGRGS